MKLKHVGKATASGKSGGKRRFTLAPLLRSFFGMPVGRAAEKRRPRKIA
jgi:hypothetical protein